MEKITLALKSAFRGWAKWVSGNRLEFFLILLTLLLSAFLRLWKISEYMTFLGDEGRDALAVKRMIVDHKFRLIGPVTSLGNMYLGPLYYYLILPSMVISRLSPVGPAVFVAVLGIITVGLIWGIGREWFGKEVGLVAALLYAISPVVIIYSRSSWNPNVMPFFALLTMYGIWRVWQKKEFFWLAIVGISFSFAVQSHYLGILLIPTVGGFWFLAMLTLVSKKKAVKKFIRDSLLGLSFFLILTILPLVWFDIRHNFINLKAFGQFFTVRQETVNLKIFKGIPGMWLLAKQMFTRLLAGTNVTFGRYISLAIGVGVVLIIIEGFTKKGKKVFLKQSQPLIFILVWAVVGLLGLSNYKQHIYDHYFGFIFPVPFFLAALVMKKAWSLGIGKVITIAGIVLLIFLAFQNSPLRYPPGNQLAKTQEVARFIIGQSDKRPFNLALVAERNYDDAYAYFLEIWDYPPTGIEPLRANETITDQLFVICEQIPCQPINHPKAEIAMFGWAKIDKKWEKDGVEIYKLSHNK